MDRRPDTEQLFKCQFCEKRFTEQVYSDHYPYELKCCEGKAPATKDICRKCVLKRKCPNCANHFEFKDDGEPDLTPKEDIIVYLETHCLECQTELERDVTDVSKNCSQCRKRLCLSHHTDKHLNVIAADLNKTLTFLNDYRNELKEQKLINYENEKIFIDKAEHDTEELKEEFGGLKLNFNRTMDNVYEFEDKCRILTQEFNDALSKPIKEIFNSDFTEMVTKLAGHKYCQDAFQDNQFLKLFTEVYKDSCEIEECWKKREEYVREKFKKLKDKNDFHKKAYIKVEDRLKTEFQNVLDTLSNNQEKNTPKDLSKLTDQQKVNDEVRRTVADITMDLWQLESFAIQSLIDYDD